MSKMSYKNADEIRTAMRAGDVLRAVRILHEVECLGVKASYTCIKHYIPWGHADFTKELLADAAERFFQEATEGNLVIDRDAPEMAPVLKRDRGRKSINTLFYECVSSGAVNVLDADIFQPIVKAILEAGYTIEKDGYTVECED